MVADVISIRAMSVRVEEERRSIENDIAEQSLQTVQNIWNNHFVTAQTISFQDSITLKGIACLEPMEFGSSVYIARDILDWNGECVSVANKDFAINTNDDKIDEKLLLYPNPNNGIFSINTTFKTVQIFNLQGKIIFVKQFEDENKEVNCKLPSGIYMVTITRENDEIESIKMVVE